VRDRTGATPYRYQPGLIDPLGQQVRIMARKLF
jgi:iron complex outermembrane recepter protein